MNKFLSVLQKLETLNNDEQIAVEHIWQRAKRICFKKGEHLSRVKDVLIFVDSGLLRHFIHDKNENEKIIQFFPEGAFFDHCEAFAAWNSTEYFIQAIEDTELMYIAVSDLEEISIQYPVLERIEKKVTDGFLATHHEHIMLLMKFNPEERYKYILETKPELIQRISVTHLAQYLDMSRETLSRMRAKIFEESIM